MILSSTIAENRASRPRRLSMLVLVAWLNMAMAPCAMAFGGEHQCPHGGAAQSAHAQHSHGHHESRQAGDCGASSECCEAQNVANDARKGHEKSGDSFEFTGHPAPIDFQRNPAPVSRLSTGPPDVGRFAAHPPVNLLNCVFLK